MNKQEKEEQKKISAILQTNQVPKINQVRRTNDLKQLSILSDGMDILAPEHFVEKILRQASYITPWTWIWQALILSACYYIIFRGQAEWAAECALIAASPCLVLVLMSELMRSFGYNMWEMEAACRYDLRQIFAMRMCIVGGTDALVLLAIFAAFRVTGGSLTVFLLFVLLPFFVMAAVCLWELIYFARKCSNFLLGATGILLTIVLYPMIEKAFMLVQNGYAEAVTGICGVITAAAMAAFMAGGICMCRKDKINKKEGRNEQWNLE